MVLSIVETLRNTSSTSPVPAGTDRSLATPSVKSTTVVPSESVGASATGVMSTVTTPGVTPPTPSLAVKPKLA